MAQPSRSQFGALVSHWILSNAGALLLQFRLQNGHLYFWASIVLGLSTIVSKSVGYWQAPNNHLPPNTQPPPHRPSTAPDAYRTQVE
jgi:hypothetical protein